MYIFWDFPGSPMVALQGAWVPSLQGKLRSHMPHSKVKKKKKSAFTMQTQMFNVFLKSVYILSFKVGVLFSQEKKKKKVRNGIWV